MKTLGLDVGEKRIGVAVSDDAGHIAMPERVLTGDRPLPEVIADIVELTQRHDAQQIVVGMPISLNGQIGPAAQKMADFARVLRKEADCEVVLWDERFTTALAEKTMIAADVQRQQRRRNIDKVAATLVLQSYLDAHTDEQPN